MQPGSSGIRDAAALVLGRRKQLGRPEPQKLEQEGPGMTSAGFTFQLQATGTWFQPERVLGTTVS